MSKNKYTAGFIFFNILFTCLLAVFIINSINFGLCFKAAEKLPDIEEYQIMRIIIYGSSITPEGDTVSANISILDTDGNDCAVIERSWNGAFLAIDFAGADFSGKKIFFPHKIYGHNTVFEQNNWGAGKVGSNLVPYYLENGQCMLLGAGYGLSDRRNMFTLANFALSPSVFIASGFSAEYTVDLSRCETGKFYAVYTDFSGKLVLKEQ